MHIQHIKSTSGHTVHISGVDTWVGRY